MSNAINARVEELREHLNTSFREIDYLETRLDRAKKDNEKLEKENKKLNIKVASLEWEIKWLNYTIEELHKELNECECSMHFENDEVWYRKRECKKLEEELSKLKEKYWDIDY